MCEVPKILDGLSACSLISYFVVNIGWTLRRHLLNDVDGLSIIATDFFVMGAVRRVRGPQGNDDITGL